MIRNHIKVSWRNLTKRKLQFTINLIGLTVSIVSAVVIALFLSHEYSFNTGFRNHESIYRVDQDYSAGDQNLYWATTPSALLPALHSQLPDLEKGTIVFDISTFTTFLVDGGDGNREEKSIAFADTSFFEVFDIEFLVGSRQKVLHEPYNVVLSESMAKRYFKDSQHAIGKVLKVNNRTEFTVAGVIPDFPSNSTLNYDFIGSFLSQPHGKDPSWSNNNYHTYLKLNPGSNPDQTSSLINEWIENEFGEDLKQNNVTTHFSLAPLSTIHFDTQREMYGSVAAMDERYLKLLGAIGLLLILELQPILSIFPLQNLLNMPKK
ncbi:ABC transporter permease [Algoriphagus confluentis]|uniref:MacB-like periplasmic core domain-containing protein n=1 Tax=Algoriphagus confluentis TaxID=1697556 RepID=A0ABQ6PRS8_9BACT|nr:hypothetical protein Aconfl_33520 [Algoriphagus confluentis]